MKELLYSALDVAALIYPLNMGIKEESELLGRIWEGEKPFLVQKYRSDQRRFLLDVRYWEDYFFDKPTIDREFPAIQKDIISSVLSEDEFLTDFSNLDLFFKSIRLRILYADGRDYICMKIRSIMRQYGYKRRSEQLILHFDRCMHFYHIEATLRGGAVCDIGTDSLDKMVTFRVI